MAALDGLRLDLRHDAHPIGLALVAGGAVGHLALRLLRDAPRVTDQSRWGAAEPSKKERYLIALFGLYGSSLTPADRAGLAKFCQKGHSPRHGHDERFPSRRAEGFCRSAGRKR